MPKTHQDDQSERPEDPPGASGRNDRFRYCPFLDGLRAISILMVLGFHQMGRISERVSNIFSGWAGVDVFFVISGFLITSLLRQEEKDHGSFSLRRFYLRRCARIWPAYYAFLVVVILTNWSDLASVATAAVYLTNYDLALGWGHSHNVEHVWSLAIEEQFYLCWPIILALAGRRAVPIAGGLIVAVWTWRIGLLLGGVPWLRLTGALDTRLDSLMIGCLAALLWARPGTRQRIRRVLAGPGVPLLVVAALLCCAQTLGHPSDPSLQTRFLIWAVRLPLFTLLVAVLILALLCHPNTIITRALSQPALVWFGRLSYSLYLWHSFAFAYLWPTVRHGLLPSVASSPWVAEACRLVLALFLASVSYYLVEKPFLSLKKRWESSRSRETAAGPHPVNSLLTEELSLHKPPATNPAHALSSPA
jgi:peptidoglycan/LPS O-acetylase OafA/YrhL